MAHEPIHTPRSRGDSFFRVGIAYGLAVAAGGGAAALTWDQPVLMTAAAADIAGTLVIFLASRWFDNSSVYDAYWSVAPPFLLALFALHPSAQGDLARQALVGATVGAWAVRLTWNWARGWHGLHEEDWRYADFRRRLGGLYWLLSFAGLHFFPTVQVFLGLLPAAFAMSSSEPLGWLGLLGGAVVAGAVVLQGVADEQLRRFVSESGPHDVLRTGLWARSRHPNYLGEVGVWLGVLLLGLDAGAPAWTSVGFVAIAGMFVGVSIPLMERRQLRKRPAYQEVIDEVPMLIPRPWSRGATGSRD